MIDIADLLLLAGLGAVAYGLWLDPAAPEILVAGGLGAIQFAVMLALRGGPGKGEDEP